MFLFPSIIYERMDPYENEKRVCGQNDLISSGKEIYNQQFKTLPKWF